MVSFKEVVAQSALEEKLAFSVDFPEKPKFKIPHTTKEVKGFKIPIFNDLLAAEAWYFELEAAKTKNQQQELQTKIWGLARDLQAALGEDVSISDAVSYLFSQASEVPDELSEAYGHFRADRVEDFLEILEASGEIKGRSTSLINRVTFFLMARVNGTWELDDTMMLPRKTLLAIDELIQSEVQGNEPEEETEEETEGKEA